MVATMAALQFFPILNGTIFIILKPNKATATCYKEMLLVTCSFAKNIQLHFKPAPFDRSPYLCSEKRETKCITWKVDAKDLHLKLVSGLGKILKHIKRFLKESMKESLKEFSEKPSKAFLAECPNKCPKRIAVEIPK